VIALGLDFGTKRVGVAISHGMVAQLHGTLPYCEQNPDELSSRLKIIIKEQKVQMIVVGLPLGRDGKETEQGRWIRRQAEILKNKLNLPVEFVEESFSTHEAKSQLGKKKKLKELVDSEAARIILEQYLNEH
jgi:putative Holliday junction resolvase